MNLDELAGSIELPEEFDGLPVFAVGGAVRDASLGEAPHDIDLMVAEVAPSEMHERGFTEIDSPNNDTFAVFLDSLGREVALAREEESTGSSHTDFEVKPVEPDVRAKEAVERDLKRRDFTVNAMALDLRHNTLHDPHGGSGALNRGILRHVSDAFSDDPLRILRGARFAARLGFDIALETQFAMEDAASELSTLPGERIRMELEKVLVEAESPRIFFDTLREVSALEVAFPELDALIGVPAGPEEHHAEGDAFEHTMLVLEQMKERRPDDEIAMLMALAHDLGKAATPEDELPSHHSHGKDGVPIIMEMAKRLSFSNEQESAMKEAASLHMRLHDIEDMRDSTVLKTWERMHNWHRMFDLMVSDGRGREPVREWSRGHALRRFGLAKAASEEVSGQNLIDAGHDPDEMGGKEFGDLLHQRRIEHMRGER